MKRFIDTAPLIYFIEGHPIFAEKVAQLISSSIMGGHPMVTSTITILEFSVKPERENKQDVIKKFNEMLSKLDIQIENIDQIIATEAYKLRARYSFLKGMDAIQIATALVTDCKEFITNDIKLKKVKDIKVIIIGE